MWEGLEELREVIFEWPFLPVALTVFLLGTIGSGVWGLRCRRSVWLLVFALVGVSLYFGVQRHEWGEVLFNGQLL